MPIPTAPSGHREASSTVLSLFEQLHDQVREEIDGLGDAGLNWKPDPGANTIATIIGHLVGSEAETLRCVAGVACSRDREGEFAREPRSMVDVLAELLAADQLIATLHSKIGRNVQTALTLPTLPAHDRRSGLTWLVGNYGHAGEHVGQIQLTKQLFWSRSTDQEAPVIVERDSASPITG